MGRKRYEHCPVCDFKSKDRDELAAHIEKTHPDVLKNKGFTAKQFLYHDRNSHNNNIGQCVECGREVEWDESRERYPRLCGSQSCKKRAHKRHKRNTKKKHGVEYRMNDPEFQREKLLKNRPNAKEYEWSRGSHSFVVLSEVEYKLLETLDKSTRLKAEDIQAPAEFVIEYKTPDGKKHQHYPDCYIEPLNLIISCKDSLENPNTHPNMKKDRLKNICEYRSILNNYEYNFLQVEGKKEVDEVPDLLKEVSNTVKRGGRYIVPPRVDVVMYNESPGYRHPIHYIIIGLDSEGRPISLFLAEDILEKLQFYHMTGKNIVIVDGENVVEKMDCLIADLTQHSRSIDIMNLYNNLELFQGKTMIDLVSYQWGVPIDYELSEKIEIIIDMLGGEKALEEYEEYITNYDEVIENFELEDGLEMSENGQNVFLNLGGEEKWEIS